MLTPLSPRQAEVFEFLKHRILDDNVRPTVREIMMAVGIRSTAGCVSYLDALERKGWIERGSRRARDVSLSKEALEDELGLKWAGYVAAGGLEEAVEQNERVDLTSGFDRRDHFVLTARGSSMEEAHITDGDYVVVRRQETARPGQIVVVATEEGEATMKFFFPERRRVRLEPANSSMKPIYVKPSNIKILGVVVSVVRRLAA